jgi:hypothetical protein
MGFTKILIFLKRKTLKKRKIDKLLIIIDNVLSSTKLHIDYLAN